MNRLSAFVVSLLLSLFIISSGNAQNLSSPNGNGRPAMLQRVLYDYRCQAWVDSVFSTMSLKERIGQLFVYKLTPDLNKEKDLLHKVIKTYHVGGLLYSKGTVREQALFTNEAQRETKIPLMITFDGEWGLSMRLKNTPVFPKNQELGYIENDSLLYEYGLEMARECKEMGVHVNFAPVADVNINPNNPVINVRSFGDDPINVARKVIAYSQGLEDGGVMAVCKHFPGHGDTDVDSHKALPLLPFDRDRLDEIELYPFREAIRSGVDGIMVGHLEVPALEPAAGLPSSLSHAVVTDFLANELNFKGLIFTDALEMKGVDDGSQTICLKALKAGNDVLLVPRRIKEEVDAILNAVKTGELSEELINEKCRKVLTYKYALGLTAKPVINPNGLEQRINAPAARNLIFRLKQASEANKKDISISTETLKQIDTIALAGIQAGAYPGCQVVVWKDGKPVYNKSFGKHTWSEASKKVTNSDIYDVASLTKTIGTLLAVMKLYDENKLSLDMTLGDLLPYLKETNKESITVEELLFHQSGLQPTIQFYQEAIDKESIDGKLFSGKKDQNHSVQVGARSWANPHFKFKDGFISKSPTSQCTLHVCDSMWLNHDFLESYRQQIADAPVAVKRYKYSDINFILLQQIVERITGMSLATYVEQVFYTPMGLRRTGYLPLRKFQKKDIVPSGIDGFVRKTTICGYVHDESAAFQGGVSGNAGVFSNAGEVAAIYQLFLNGGEWKGRRYLSKETCQLFTTKTSTISHRGLGFDKPNMKNPKLSNCCDLANASVFGHTGFTGTCVWADPTNGFVYVFLSNRTYPNSWNRKLSQLDIRTRINNVVYRALK